MWKKITTRNIVVPEQPIIGMLMNNQAWNPSLMTDMQALFVIGIVAFSHLPLFFLSHYYPSTNSVRVTFPMYRLAIMGLFLPSLIYYFNKALLSYYTREFWDVAPDWLQNYNPVNATLPQSNRIIRSRNSIQISVIG